MLERIDLGRHGRNYVVDRLIGAEDLSARLSKMVSKESNIYSPLPAGVSLKRATDFETGGLEFPEGGPLDWLFGHLQTFQTGYLFNHDLWAVDCDHRGDNSYISDNKRSYYYKAANCIGSSEELIKFIWQPISFDVVMWYADVSKSEIDSRDEDAFIEKCEEIYIPVYDQEGYLICDLRKPHTAD